MDFRKVCLRSAQSLSSSPRTQLLLELDSGSVSLQVKGECAGTEDV
jgi:hypothetical protein